MAPPDWGEDFRDGDNSAYFKKPDIALDGNPSFPDAKPLGVWIEFLLNPEMHIYDRTVDYGDERGKVEEPGNVFIPQRGGPGSGDDPPYPYESVIEGYYISQFFDHMVAVSTPQVERPQAPLSKPAAAIGNVYWFGDLYANSLSDGFPSEADWSGDARKNAESFVRRLVEVVNQVDKIVKEDGFVDMAVQYAMIISMTRRKLNETARKLVEAFEKKFAERGGGIQWDVLGVALVGILAAGAATYFTAGLAAPTAVTVAEAMMAQAWSTAVTGAAETILSKDERKQGEIAGFWWRELVESYLRTQADIMNDARAQVDALRNKIDGLIAKMEAAPHTEVDIDGDGKPDGTGAMPQWNDTIPAIP